MIHDRLLRKEELLRDYEKDLGKLRQAELLIREKDCLLQDLEVRTREIRNRKSMIGLSCFFF